MLSSFIIFALFETVINAIRDPSWAENLLGLILLVPLALIAFVMIVGLVKIAFPLIVVLGLCAIVLTAL